MRRSRHWMVILLCAVMLFAIVGCTAASEDDDDDRDRDDDEKSDGDTDSDDDPADGDPMTDGDGWDWPVDGEDSDRDDADGDDVDGDFPDGDETDGDGFDGDFIDGDFIDGDLPEYEVLDGDWIDTDPADGDGDDGEMEWPADGDLDVEFDAEQWEADAWEFREWEDDVEWPTYCQAFSQHQCGPGRGCVVVASDGTAMCVAIGTAAEGENCSPLWTWAACAEGLICQNDDFDAESGACKPLCLPFNDKGQDCQDPQAFCAPMESYLGYCQTVTLGLTEGDDCESPGAWCDVNVRCLGTEESASCMRLCTLLNDDGPCIGGDSCLQVWESDSIGLCYPGCTPFSSGECGEGFGCWPDEEGGGHCVAVGEAGLGDVCAPPFNFSACHENLLCMAADADEPDGICRPICDLNGDGSDCGVDEVCLKMLTSDVVGICSALCEPYEEDDGCDGETWCFPNPDDGGQCVSHGDAAVGEACDTPYSYAACAAGSLCMPENQNDPTGICEEICDPFRDGEVGGCSQPDEYCLILQDWIGTCSSDTLDLAEGDFCDSMGAFCTENVMCIGASVDDAYCLRLCRLAEGNVDCEGGKSCVQALASDDFGICLDN